jgi:hypothetical protein
MKVLLSKHRKTSKFIRKSRYANAGRNVSVRKTTFFQSADYDTR